MSEALALTRPPMPAGPVTGPSAWYGRDMRQRRDWLHHFTEDELAELDAAIREHGRSGRSMGEITPESFRLPRLAPRLQAILTEILEGRGFVQFRGFPVERYSIEESAVA